MTRARVRGAVRRGTAPSMSTCEIRPRGAADLARDLRDALAQRRHRDRAQEVGRALVRGAAAVDRVALARRRDEARCDRVQFLAPFADRDRVAVLGDVGERGIQPRHDERPVVARRRLQRADQLAARAVLERGEVRAADRRARDVHPRARFEPRDEHGRAGADHVDRDHVEAVAHREVDGQRCLFGEFDEERPRACTDVEVAQEAVAEFEHRRRQHEALAVGQLEQEARADERRRDARHGWLRDACQFCQFAVADRGIGDRDAAQDRQTAREGRYFVGGGFPFSGEGLGVGACRHGNLSFFET